MITIVMMMKVQQFYHRVVNGEDQVGIIPNLPDVPHLKRLLRDAIDQNIWTLMECRIARFGRCVCKAPKLENVGPTMGLKWWRRHSRYHVRRH